MKDENIDNNQRKKKEEDSKGFIEKSNDKLILGTDNDLDKEESSYFDVDNLFEDAFKGLPKDNTKQGYNSSDSITDLFKLDENNLGIDSSKANTELYKHERDFPEKSVYSNEIQLNYERKNKELEEKISEYDEKYQILVKKIEEYEEKTSGLIKKRKEFDESIKEYEVKTRSLEERNEEISNQMRKLKEAREKIIELSKQIEEKKADLEKRDEILKKSEKNLEKIKFELERNKLEFEKNKLEFEIGKSNLDTELVEIPEIVKESKEFNQITEVEKEKKSGKGEILQNLMANLLQNGNFKSCFLIDGKGMLISEYSSIQLDSIAIGAMFSLICTTILRAVKTLNLYELEFFKLSSTSGEFIMKNINIMNYERNFILLAYYDDSNSTITESKQIINKKIIKRILKNVKEDFYELGNGSKSSGIFDNLNDRLNFLKKRYTIPQEELELTRTNLLNEISVKIKELFEK
ncbi:MAG: hypothetical protein ACFFEY_11600 [Candidatus Thorarchaeota archaeon]